MVQVYIPSPLHSYTKGKAETQLSAATVAELLSQLDHNFPGLKFRIIDEQEQIRTHIKIFVDKKQIQSLSIPLSDKSEVHIICALSGG